MKKTSTFSKATKRVAVDGFVKDAEQFDDLTMLCVEYKGNETADDSKGE